MAPAIERVVTLLTALGSALLLVVFVGSGVRELQNHRDLAPLRIAERGRPPIAGLRIERVLVTPYPSAQGEALVLRGELTNDTSAPQKLPPLRVTLMDASGEHETAIVARTPPALCALAAALEQTGPQALEQLLAASPSESGPIPPRGHRPLFAVLPHYTRGSRPAWVTVDWLPAQP